MSKELYYDYFNGRSVRVSDKTAAEFEVLRERAKLAANNPVEARAIIIAANHLVIKPRRTSQ